MDIEPFKRAAVRIANRHQVPNDSLNLFPDGSNIIFAHGSHQVIKIFPALLKDQFDSERLVLKHLQHRLAISTPSLEYSGEFEGWPYLIMSRVEGETLESLWVNLPFENKLTLIQEIGSLIKEVHSLGTLGLEPIDSSWEKFIENQISLCVERHRANHLKKQLLSELPDFLKTARKILPPSIAPVLLTGEYTPFNLLAKRVNGRWTLSGMIDFGYCMLGFREYDLLGPGAFLIQGDKTLLRAFPLSYGYVPKELNSDLSHRLTALMLLHRFSNLRIQLRVPDWETKVTSLEDLLNLVWGLGLKD